jgi:hypothetical protein
LLATLLYTGWHSAAAADEPMVDENTNAAGESRMVWVLTETAEFAAEAGRVSDETSAVVPYEIKCAMGKLRASRRNLGGLGLYGAPSWTIRLPVPLTTPEGAQQLHTALEHICNLAPSGP